MVEDFLKRGWVKNILKFQGFVLAITRKTKKNNVLPGPGLYFACYLGSSDQVKLPSRKRGCQVRKGKTRYRKALKFKTVF